jgi:hypothetical protein
LSVTAQWWLQFNRNRERHSAIKAANKTVDIIKRVFKQNIADIMQTLIQFPCLRNDCGSRMEKVFAKSQIYSAGLCGVEYVDSLNRNSNKGT